MSYDFLIESIISKCKTIENKISSLSENDRIKCLIYTRNFFNSLFKEWKNIKKSNPADADKIEENLHELEYNFDQMWGYQIISGQISENLNQITFKLVKMINDSYDPLNLYKLVTDKQVDKYYTDEDEYYGDEEDTEDEGKEKIKDVKDEKVDQKEIEVNVNEEQLTKLVNFITKVIIDLVTKTSLDHRNYNRDDHPSLLRKLVELEGFDKAIKTLANKFYEKGISIISQEIDEEDGDEDEEMDRNDELFSVFISTVGLFELSNLHLDHQDEYKIKLLEIFK